MSHNTNTLFWIITGAVVVLGVFLLINNSQSNSLSRIGNRFGSAWSNQRNYEEEQYMPLERSAYKDYYLENSNRYYCRVNGNVDEKYEIKAEVLNMYVDNEQVGKYEWILTNVGNDDIYNFGVYLNIYDCEDNQLISNAWWGEERFEAGREIYLTTWGGVAKTNRWNYYVEISF